jgi:hypothetical protein
MTTKTKCDKIFYFRVGIDPDPKNQYDLLDARNCISDTLELYKFRHVDSTGGQASFKPRGDFKVFKFIVELIAEKNNIRIRDIKLCDDPGLGLFWD